jgi:hypothetical protein
MKYLWTILIALALGAPGCDKQASALWLKEDVTPRRIIQADEITANSTITFDIAGSDELTITAAGLNVPAGSSVVFVDDAEISFGTGSDVVVGLGTGNDHASSGDEDFLIALSDTSQSIHITDKAALATDWNLAAVTHPTLYIHSNTTPATDFLRIGTHDGTDAYIDMVGGTGLNFQIGGTGQVEVTDGVLAPVTTNDIDLGTTSLVYKNAYMTGTLDFNTGVINSTAMLTFQIGAVDILGLDDSAITLAAATDTAGQDLYIQTEDAGGTATAARVGGLLELRTGDGSAGASAVVAGAGGALNFASGAGGAQTGTVATGQGGEIDLTSGAGGASSGAGGAGSDAAAGGLIDLNAGAGGATAATDAGAHAGAGGAIELTGGAGGIQSGAGGGNGGAGGAITLLAGAGASGTADDGDGGAATLTGGASGGADGAGGAATVTAGASIAGATGDGGIASLVGGASGSTAGAGGAALVTGGLGTTTGNGGAATITGGVAGTTGNGGAASLTGGASGTGATGTGGNASVTGGANANAIDGAGGTAVIAGGAGKGTGAGGLTSVTGGASGGGATGNGGAASVVGGAATSTNGTGGAVAITGGVATGTGTGGAITITAGASAGASGTGGAVTIDAGAPTAGTAADITIGGTSAKDISLTPIYGYLNQEGVPERYRLTWVAGARGKPGLNADILNATESTRMITDPDFEVTPNGTNASSDDVTYYAEGGIDVETDGTDGDSVSIIPHLDANQSAWTQVTWGTDKEVRWDCTITTGPAITTCIIWAGLKLTDTPVTATDADQVFFRYEDDVNSGKWQAVSSIGDSDDAHDTGVTVAINTKYHFTIIIAADRTARFFINGVLEETSAALTDAVDLIPYIGIEEDGAGSAMTLYIHNQAISRTIN